MTTPQVLLPNGDHPPQPGVPKDLSIEEMLLYSAWAHGLKSGDAVHRLALFSYIQSHVSNKADETLQTIIEKRPLHWIRQPGQDGFYIVQKNAIIQAWKMFGDHNIPVKFSSRYSFQRIHDGHQFTVVVDIPSRKLILELDGRKVNGPRAVTVLASLGQKLSNSQSSQPRKVFNWIIRDNNYTWSTEYTKTLEETKSTYASSIPSLVQEEDDELSFPEGAEIYRIHRSKERNKALIDMVKGKYLQQDKQLRCQMCGFSFLEVYGDPGLGFIEAHHTSPLSELSEQTETKVGDIVLVCSNCHRMLHRRRPWISTEELHGLINKNKTSNSAG